MPPTRHGIHEYTTGGGEMDTGPVLCPPLFCTPVYVAGSEEGRCTSTLPVGVATIWEKDRAQVGTECLVWVFEHTIDDTG